MKWKSQTRYFESYVKNVIFLWKMNVWYVSKADFILFQRNEYECLILNVFGQKKKAKILRRLYYDTRDKYLSYFPQIIFMGILILFNNKVNLFHADDTNLTCVECHQIYFHL